MSTNAFRLRTVGALFALALAACEKGGSTAPTPVPTPDPNRWPQRYISLPNSIHDIPAGWYKPLPPHRAYTVCLLPMGPGTFQTAFQWVGYPTAKVVVYLWKKQLGSECHYHDGFMSYDCVILAFGMEPFETVQWTTAESDVSVCVSIRNYGDAPVEDFQGDMAFQASK
jgi:hypothetical protein